MLSFGARFCEEKYGPDAIRSALESLVDTGDFTLEELLALRSLTWHRKWQLAAGLLRALQVDPLEFVHDCLKAVSYTHLTLPTTPYV